MKHSILCALLLVIFSCKEKPEQNESAHSIDSLQIDQLKIVNETDPICAMDVKEHVSDTALIHGEIWDFAVLCAKKNISIQKNRRIVVPVVL